MENDCLLEVRNYKKWYTLKKKLFGGNASYVKAADGVSFSILRGETFGLVGESGCGKTTVGKGILRLHEPTDGEVLFEGKDILKLEGNELREIRRDMQIIYQDPYSSLNPRMTVGNIIGEPLEIHKIASGAEKEKRIRELMDRVGLPATSYNRYPHEFSGGQRQRVGIARALCLNPKLIVCDEPVSALDVSIQSQILNLLEDLQEDLGLTYLFIAHGLTVVKHISSRIGVMYLGKLIELADSDSLFATPVHPYTRALLSAIPSTDPTIHKERILLEGDVPSPINLPTGCRFHTRCHYCQEICRVEEPQFNEIAPGHFCACHLSVEFIGKERGK